MLALYRPGRSLFHRSTAGLKIAVLAAFAIIVSAACDPFVLAIFLAATVFSYRYAELPVAAIITALQPALPLLIVLAGIQCVSVDTRSAVLLLTRIIIIVLAAALVTYTTRTTDMIEGIARSLRPLARFGVSPSKVGLALALTIRFIPAIMQQYGEVQAARVARGGRRFSALALGPLILSAVRMADEIGDAVAARGFEERENDDR